jgi:hypothetical protein
LVSFYSPQGCASTAFSSKRHPNTASLTCESAKVGMVNFIPNSNATTTLLNEKTSSVLSESGSIGHETLSTGGHLQPYSSSFPSFVASQAQFGVLPQAIFAPFAEFECTVGTAIFGFLKEM